jgi:hypothetical protein
MSASDSLNGKRPAWFRCDNNILRTPKLAALRRARRWPALCLYIEGIGYANSNLTDGLVPQWFPADYGYKPGDAAALVDAALWIPVTVAGLQPADDCGWLIHDYLAYQRSKDDWDAEHRNRSERARAAARARWEKK